MKLYFVTYDHLINGKYHQKTARFFARNAKDAKDQIKYNYYQELYVLQYKGHSVAQAHKIARYPFHIEAVRL